MKYTFNLKTTVDIPKETVFVLLYVKKSGQTGVYPISKILNQNYKHLKAEVLGKGIRTFITANIITLDPVKNNN